MNVRWKTDVAQPILLKRAAEWSGLKVRQTRVMPGELIDHTSRTHEVTITLAGSVTMSKQTQGGRIKKRRGKTGDVCLTSAGQTINASWEEDYEYLVIDLEPEFFRQTAIENRFNPNFELAENFAGRDPLIQNIGFALLDEATSETPAGRLYAESLGQTLTLHLLKKYSTAGSPAENLNGGLPAYKLRVVTDFINDKLEDDLTLAELASVAGLSRFHFARAFRRTTGLTPQQYLMKQRIERAKELLKDRDLPLVEISFLTGFKNQSHFTTLFRKFTNLTPGAWRELKLA